MTTRTRQDPKAQYPEPPFPKQQQEPPGTEADLKPKADHGQESYEGSGRLTDRVALITGGDSGIGKAVAIAFAREGADVVVSYLGGVEEADAADTADWVEKAGRRALTVKPADFARPANVVFALDHVEPRARAVGSEIPRRRASSS